ncbi:MAG: hypothetical protein J6P03_04590, partial [Opitutales bacterium]|nr:hypothetical protein [Opitutales bacterium]
MNKSTFLEKIYRLFAVRNVAIFLIYSAIAFISLNAAYFLRFDLNFESGFAPVYVFLIFLFFKIAALMAFKQFRGLLTSFHMPDMIKLFWAITASSVIILFLSLSIGHHARVPRGVILADYILSLILYSGFRIYLRFYRERGSSDNIHSHAEKRVAVIGAGDIGTSLAANLISRKALGAVPVVFLDDDDAKIGKQILGLDVLPLSTDFKKLVEIYKIDRAVIAISNISKKRISEITTNLSKNGVETNIVPSYYDLSMGFAKVSNLREVSIADVLGREQVSLDSESIGAMIGGKVIMVTGAGGSIGSELCKQ